MSRTTKNRAPLCQSCGKSTRHHSPKYCRPCAESVAKFAEKFDGRGSGVQADWDALLAPLTPSQRLTLALALVDDVETAALERSRKSMAAGNAPRSIRLDALADRLQRVALDIAQCETEWTRIL